MSTTNLYKLSLCVEVPPFHWIDDYRKKFREYILLTRSPSKYFSTFQKLFEDVYICYCCCFYSTAFCSHSQPQNVPILYIMGVKH